MYPRGSHEISLNVIKGTATRLNPLGVYISGLRKMKNKSKFISMLLVMGCFSKIARWTPGNKDHFYFWETVFQFIIIGQSTVLYLEFKPEVVICGNKNYFSIEKLKKNNHSALIHNFYEFGCLSGNKRYLFYLTPSKVGFLLMVVDVKWVSANQIKLAPAQGRNLKLFENSIKD